MAFQLKLRRFHKSQILLRILLFTGAVFLLSSQFQNCAPVGDAKRVGDETVSLNSLINCSALPAPKLSQGPENQTGKSGLGVYSGTVLPKDLLYTLTLGDSKQLVDVNCKVSGLDGLRVNCNQNSRKITITSNKECLSGRATVSVTATDTLCAKTSNNLSFTVDVANVCPDQIKVKNPDPEASDQFGGRVAISGSYAVIVANSDNNANINAGAAYVYYFNGSSWDFKQKLVPSELGVQSELYSAAISGSTIVLGAPYRGDHGGAFVYKFNGTNWVEVQELVPNVWNVTLDSDLFGFDVAVEGNTIVVGAPGHNHGDVMNLIESGAVFIFEDNGASVNQVKVLKASNRMAHDYFGASVSISGSRVAVGAPSSPTADKNTYKGKAYVFHDMGGGTWTESQLNGGNDVSFGHQFGSSLDIDSTKVVVGSKNGNTKAGSVTGGTGVAYVFKESGTAYVVEAVLKGVDSGAGDQFGSSVAIKGSQILVGAPLHSLDNLIMAGAVYYYTFTNNSWVHKFKLFPRLNDRGDHDQFGESVDLNGTWMVGGSRLDDDGPTSDSVVINSGSSFFIRLP